MLKQQIFRLDSVVQFTVGPEKQVFHIHKGLLCNAAAYFRAALEGGFKEVCDHPFIVCIMDPITASEAFKS